MRPSATIIAILLFAANAGFVYFWLFDTDSDLKSAEVQIRKQAFHNAKKIIEASEVPDSRLNPNLQKAFKKEAVVSPKPISSLAQAPSTNESPQAQLEEVYASFVEGDEGGARLWCRPADVEVRSFPARCVYKGNCFRCTDSELIKPDAEMSTPFCSDGQMARRFDTECCPSGFNEAGYKCPDMPTCLNAEPVPTEGCSCGGSSECHFNPIANSPGCRCSGE